MFTQYLVLIQRIRLILKRVLLRWNIPVGYICQKRAQRRQEGFVRPDTIQVIEIDHIEPTQTALTEDAWFFISERLRYYLTNQIETIFLDERREMMSVLP
jgi:hypothetical protein